MARDEVMVQRSGDLYLVGNRREAIAVDVEEESTSDVLSTQAFLAHSNVQEAWEVLTDHEQLPEPVRAAVETFRQRVRDASG